MIKRISRLVFLASLLTQSLYATDLYPTGKDEHAHTKRFSSQILVALKPLSSESAALHAAAKSLSIQDLVKCLLIDKTSPNTKSKGGTTPLLRVLAQEDVNPEKQLMAATLLLDYRADVNLSALESPIHVVCEYTKDSRLLDLLLERKANVDAQNNCGQTPLHLASLLGNDTYVERLLNAKATINIRDHVGLRTPILAAANTHRDNTKVLSLLLAAKANPNDEDEYGTVLHNLTEYNRHSPSITLLLRNGADVKKRGKKGLYAGKTPLEIVGGVRDPLDSGLLASQIVGVLWKKELPSKAILQNFLQEMQQDSPAVGKAVKKGASKKIAQLIEGFSDFLDISTMDQDEKYTANKKLFLKDLQEVAANFDLTTLSRAIDYIQVKYAGIEE